jgi:hypothetical protein
MFRFRLNLRGFVLIAALLLGGGRAFAEENTESANYVVEGCRHFMNSNDNGNSFQQGWCVGVLSALVTLPNDVCPPTGVTRTQTARVVVQYIDNRPARMHEAFVLLALEALNAAWPCKR